MDLQKVLHNNFQYWRKQHKYAKWEMDTIVDRITRYVQNPESLYPDIYYSKREKYHGRRYRSGWRLVTTLNVTSVIDFGCATGSYLEGVVAAGVPLPCVKGVELNYNRMMQYIPETLRANIVPGHVGRYISSGGWDCAMSLDVAEHLLPEEEDVFIGNLIRASDRLIVFSGSNKPNEAHFNRHTREHWIGRFTLEGCKYLKDETEALKTAWLGRCGLRYIREGLCVFNVGNAK